MTAPMIGEFIRPVPAASYCYQILKVITENAEVRNAFSANDSGTTIKRSAQCRTGTRTSTTCMA